jgi:hypothetical protein
LRVQIERDVVETRGRFERHPPSNGPIGG